MPPSAGTGSPGTSAGKEKVAVPALGATSQAPVPACRAVALLCWVSVQDASSPLTSMPAVPQRYSGGLCTAGGDSGVIQQHVDVSGCLEHQEVLLCHRFSVLGLTDPSVSSGLLVFIPAAKANPSLQSLPSAP